MPWRDRVIGVALGVALGLGVIILFVFVYSAETVDAPSLSKRPGRAHTHVTRGGGRPARPPVATVRVIGGAPPSSGPAELHYRTGDPVRLSVVSDTTITVALLGYGINRTVAANRPTAISFRAQRPGNYPLVVTASHIAVARITVGGPAP